ncbi:hypothetical protein B6U99_05375 [Candidatus Geothermarchaeota archaeon ex4572_27]|nr:MAG: hypothetical protein B6U99_05375 [Candidatus Geothermarchaeota archaeon ex4572_27]
MWTELAYIALLAVGFILGLLAYRARAAKVLRAVGKLLDELGDDAEALADYLANPTDENAKRVLEELKDDLPALAEVAKALKG